MNVSKIKTMVIIALLLVNSVFVTVIVIDAVADTRSERQAIENACEILTLGGITISPESIKTSGAIRTMRTMRDNAAEAAIANAALGTVEMTDQGVICHYENAEHGTAEFNSAGDFDIQLNDGAIPNNADGKLKSAQNLLRKMKIEASYIYISNNEETETVVAICAYKKASIFNCVIEFHYSGESISSVRGRCVTGIDANEDGDEISTVATILLSFLALHKRGDVECTKITSVEAGYQYHATGSFGEGIITPAWLITTDTGRYIIDDTTREIVSRRP